MSMWAALGLLVLLLGGITLAEVYSRHGWRKVRRAAKEGAVTRRRQPPGNPGVGMVTMWTVRPLRRARTPRRP